MGDGNQPDSIAIDGYARPPTSRSPNSAPASMSACLTAAPASNGPVSSQPNSRDIEWLSARTWMPAISNEPTRKNGISASGRPAAFSTTFRDSGPWTWYRKRRRWPGFIEDW